MLILQLLDILEPIVLVVLVVVQMPLTHLVCPVFSLLVFCERFKLSIPCNLQILLLRMSPNHLNILQGMPLRREKGGRCSSGGLHQVWFILILGRRKRNLVNLVISSKFNWLREIGPNTRHLILLVRRMTALYGQIMTLLTLVQLFQKLVSFLRAFASHWSVWRFATTSLYKDPRIFFSFFFAPQETFRDL